jgi:Lipocalin-like domain
MKAFSCLALAAVMAFGGLSLAQSPAKKLAAATNAKEQLIGAWRLVSMEEPGADGKLNHITDRRGMLLYTRDGHMSVQLMFPDSQSNVSNDYVQNGYEASFGSYDVDEAAHTVTHHVQGSVTRGLAGKDLPRAFQLSDGRLIITSTRPDEHWSVTWEHY